MSHCPMHSEGSALEPTSQREAGYTAPTRRHSLAGRSQSPALYFPEDLRDLLGKTFDLEVI